MPHDALLYAGIITGMIIFWYRVYYLPGARLNGQKRQYQSAAEPSKMEQVGENDREFYERVQRERARYVDAGNNWALKQNPVIAIWRNRAFTIVWFGKEYDYSTVGLSQMDYHRAAQTIYTQLSEIWSRETNIFGDDTFAQATGQKPFDANKTWVTD